MAGAWLPCCWGTLGVWLPHLQGFQQLLSCGDVGHVDGGAERVEHFHFLQDIFAASGPDDQKLAALIGAENVKMHSKLS